MERNYGKEIDAIQTQLNGIKAILRDLRKNRSEEIPNLPKGNLRVPLWDDSVDKRLASMQIELCKKREERGNTGFVTYFGVYSTASHGNNWISETNVDRLLELIESNIAAKVLACIGSNQRLNLLLALLRAPRTAAQLVEECGYNTTGQVYHHLKPLLAADLVKEEEQLGRGYYVIQSHRIQGVVMLLAGISDLVCAKYSSGAWDAVEDNSNG